MLTTTVRDDGTVRLGDDARRAGFEPGVVVNVLVTRAGSLIVSLDQSPPLDVPYRAVVGGAAQLALRKGRHR